MLPPAPFIYQHPYVVFTECKLVKDSILHLPLTHSQRRMCFVNDEEWGEEGMGAGWDLLQQTGTID